VRVGDDRQPHRSDATAAAAAPGPAGPAATVPP
jgi:hypothetical protein